MENGLRRSRRLRDGEPGSYREPSASQVGAPPQKKRLLTPRLMSVFLPGDEARWRDGSLVALRIGPRDYRRSGRFQRIAIPRFHRKFAFA